MEDEVGASDSVWVEAVSLEEEDETEPSMEALMYPVRSHTPA